MNYCVNIFDKETRESSCVSCASLEDFVLYNWRDDDADFIGAKLAEIKASMKLDDAGNTVWEDDEYTYTMTQTNGFITPKLRVEYEPTQEDFGEFNNLREWIMQCYYTPEDHEQWLEDYEEDEKYEDSVDFICEEINADATFDEDEFVSYWNGYKFSLSGEEKLI